MEHYAGLDVSVKETSVCIVDGAGKVIREVKIATEPEAIRAVLVDETFTIKRMVSRRVRYRSGFTADWPKLSYRSSASRRDI